MNFLKGKGDGTNYCVNMSIFFIGSQQSTHLSRSFYSSFVNFPARIHQSLKYKKISFYFSHIFHDSSFFFLNLVFMKYFGVKMINGLLINVLIATFSSFRLVTHQNFGWNIFVELGYTSFLIRERSYVLSYYKKIISRRAYFYEPIFAHAVLLVGKFFYFSCFVPLSGEL